MLLNRFGISLDRLGESICPDILNVLSELALVVGMAKSSLANSIKEGSLK